MVAPRCTSLLLWVLLVCSGAGRAAGVTAAAGGAAAKLQRQSAKRWTRVDEIARDEIKSTTKRFLEERNHVRL